MDRNYSYFEHKQIDWNALTQKYRERAEAVAEKPAEFVGVIKEMLTEMKDGHIWITSEGETQYTFGKNWKGNFDFEIVDDQLKTKKGVGNFAVVGKTKNGLGYVRVLHLIGVQRSELLELATEIDKLFATPGMIIDLRKNKGGAEPTAMALAGIFTNEQQIYARQKFRSGPSHSSFYETVPRAIQPRNNKTYTKPMVCLIGPGAVSSAEGFALMMKALPHCQTVGQPTRGSSGNPSPVILPNGVEVFYSRWVAMDAEGTPIEDTGVEPDVKVEHKDGKDTAFDRAIELLSK